MSDDILPYGRHSVDDDDIAAVCEVLRGDWLTNGPTVGRFEQALARKVDAEQALACSSGTAALHLAALALELTEGDTVVVPAVTFLATANAVRYVGAEILFADVDPGSGLMGEAGLAEALARNGRDGNRAKAVFPVHLNGQPGDAGAIRRLALERELWVVEDASHSLGSSLRTDGGELSIVGDCRFSEMTVFSFHPVKVVAMGEGGGITTNDARLAERVRRLRNHGMRKDVFEIADQAVDEFGEPNPWYYEMAEIGFNYRISDLHCALGLSQLKKLDGFVTRRRALASLYDELLAPLVPVVTPIKRTDACRPAWHLYVVLIDFDELDQSRAQVMKALAASGVQTQVHYLPVHRQPYYRARYGDLSLPGADAYYARCLSLPLYPSMTDTDVHRVVDTLMNIVRG